MGYRVGRRDGRHLAVVREEFGCSSDSDALGFRDIKFVAAIVLHGWAYIPCFLAVGCPALACLGIFKDESSGSRRSKGCLVVIEESIYLCMGREVGVDPGCAEEIQRQYGLGDELIP
jgi:hypothetical protein